MQPIRKMKHCRKTQISGCVFRFFRTSWLKRFQMPTVKMSDPSSVLRPQNKVSDTFIHLWHFKGESGWRSKVTEAKWGSGSGLWNRQVCAALAQCICHCCLQVRWSEHGSHCVSFTIWYLSLVFLNAGFNFYVLFEFYLVDRNQKLQKVVQIFRRENPQMQWDLDLD